MTLFQYQPHPHETRNPNLLHEAEIAVAAFNQRLAFKLAGLVDSMWTTYIFTCISFAGLLGLLGWLNPFIFLLMTWLSQQFLQLVYLPIITVKQGIQERKVYLQVEESYKNTIMMQHNLKQIADHLVEQDKELIRQSQMIAELSTAVMELLEQRDYIVCDGDNALPER
jgi:hypothetical protein